MSLAWVTHCPTIGCLSLIVPAAHPSDKRSFDPRSNKFHLICEKCLNEVDVSVSDLKPESVSPEWMQRNYPSQGFPI